jgi:hypothetical protein
MSPLESACPDLKEGAAHARAALYDHMYRQYLDSGEEKDRLFWLPSDYAFDYSGISGKRHGDRRMAGVFVVWGRLLIVLIKTNNDWPLSPPSLWR